MYRHLINSLRNMMGQILEPRLDLDEFLSQVARHAKGLNPNDLEARVYEVDFNENFLYLRTSTLVNVDELTEAQKKFDILPHTMTGDATIENRVIVADINRGATHSRFSGSSGVRAAFPIEFYDLDLPEGRTKYVLVVEKRADGPILPEILDALNDFSVLAGLAISIKELRDNLSRYYAQNRNLVLTGRHSAAVGHDIRSLNVGVGGYLTLALRNLESGADGKRIRNARKYTGLAQGNAKQIEALLKNFSHFNRAAITLNRDTDLVEAVAEKLTSLKNRLEFSRHLRFNLQLPRGKCGFQVDRDWFGTVIDNLVRNSMDACQGSALISIRLDEKEDKITLNLKDNCGGIPSELLPDIFTPFRSGKKTGQGLGLANAKKVVEDHGGTMQVNNHPGCGVEFVIEFPFKPEKKQGDNQKSP